MPVHEEVLIAARRLGAEREDWTFTPDEVVRALPHLNASSVRTHVTSRCCVNAPANHPHRWEYFQRIARGVYRVLPAVRGRKPRVSESRAEYKTDRQSSLRAAIHSVISRSDKYFVAECLEIPVVSQARTLDEMVANLKEAIALHLEGEHLPSLGLSLSPRLVLTFETSLSATEA